MLTLAGWVSPESWRGTWFRDIGLGYWLWVTPQSSFLCVFLYVGGCEL